MYKLRIEAVSPKTIEVDKEITINFKFTNISDRLFPGANDLLIRMIWANIDAKNIHVNRPFSLPQINVNQPYNVEYKETPRIDGALLFYFFNNNRGEFYANDGEEIELHNVNSRFLVNSIFHVVRVQSKEEKYQ